MNGKSELENLHSILDAWYKGEVIQCKHKTLPDPKWIRCSNDLRTIEFDNEYTYRIKPKETPLPIPIWFWRGINKGFTKAVIDENLTNITFFPEQSYPFVDGDFWVTCDKTYYTTINADLLGMKTDGIDWEMSLTKRPEGL